MYKERLQSVLKNLHYDEAVVIGSIFGENSKALIEATKFISDITGDCPFGMYGYYNDCTDNCYPSKEPACWRKYFIDKNKKDGVAHERIRTD